MCFYCHSIIPENEPISANFGYRLSIRGKKVRKAFLNAKTTATLTEIS